MNENLKNASGEMEWVTITWQEYGQLIKDAAKSFLHLGLPQFGSVCIIGFNKPAWYVISQFFFFLLIAFRLISYMGAVWCGAKGVGI
jgi:long-subunit acyl-CoA synthetase (AMP-forming)